MLRVEFHCHTNYSKDSLTQIEDLLEACRVKGIDRLVVTDHNTIAGALAARRLDPKRVIVGEEIMTRRGELLAAYVQEEVPPGLEPLEAVRRLKEQGAFISVSHPFDRFRSPWGEQALLEILPHLDALEGFNARCLFPGFNWQAQRFARRHGLPITSGSDAHTLEELGAAVMLLDDFDSPGTLRRAVRSGKRENRLSPPWVHFASRRAARAKRSQG